MGKTTPRTEQRRLVALWRTSTLSMSAFARAHNVLPVTFRSWVARHDRPLTVPSTAFSFIQVTTAPMLASSSSFVVHLDGHALCFETPPPPAWFAALIREIAPC